MRASRREHRAFEVEDFAKMTTTRVGSFSFGTFLLAILAVGLVLSQTSLSAKPAQDQGSKFDLEGKITDLSAGRLTVSTEDNIVFHVTYNDKTAIHRKDGTPGSSKDLAAGEKIKVEGVLTPAGVIEAETINLE